MISVGINGAAGRMGQRLVALASEDASLKLAAALERAGHEQLGQDAGLVAGAGELGVALAEHWRERPDVVIDFTRPEALAGLLAKVRAEAVAVVVGTTGLGPAEHLLLDEAAGEVAVLQAPNTSLGVNLLFALAGQVARQLGEAYDIEIVEAHHRFKADAPSGTALGLAEAICRATGKSVERDVVHGRSGQQPRKPGEIGMHAMRLGDEVGRHVVSFGAPGEQIELGHRATTRDVFVRGALRAAQWIAEKPPGRYTMADVLGLDSAE